MKPSGLTYAWSMLLAACCAACAIENPIRLPDPVQGIVITGLIQPGAAPAFRVSRVLPPLAIPDTSQYLADAQVRVQADGAELPAPQYLGSGLFQSSAVPVPGQIWEVFVSHPSLPPAQSAPVEVPVRVQALHAEFQDSMGIGLADTLLTGTLRISFQDPSGVRNYYQIQLRDGDTVRNAPLYQALPVSGAWMGCIRPAYVFSDSCADGGRMQVNLMVGPYYTDDGVYRRLDSLRVDVISVSESVYRYASSLAARPAGDLEALFISPVPIQSNIEGGYGIVGAASQAVCILRVPR